MSPEDAPILDGAVLWHPWERAILLSGYQFVIVAYKVLPPKTSSTILLCGGAYNFTEIAAPECYLQWERELENWTQRSLALTPIPNSEVGTRVRLARNTRTINFTKREEFPIPRLILHRNTLLLITHSFMSVPTTSELMNLSSTLNSTLEINAIHSKITETTTNSASDITKSALQPTNTIKPL